MASDLNTVALVGRVTRDGELKYTAGGTAKLEFSVAVNRRVKKGEEWSDVASFFDVTLWAKSAENLQKYIVKGQQVALTAELEQQRWEKDGQKFSKIALANVQVQLVGGGKREGSAPAPSGRGEQHPNETYEDNIPF
ncbi:MAG: single-stranded DNA-binding protein [Spirochaetales bacterium]